MRLLVKNYGDVRIFKDKSLFGLPRWIVEFIDPDFGFHYTSVFSAIWYKEKDIIKIAEKRIKELDEKEKE
tara:strand:+ start:5087 stop:5296 length:210 start_codon:yes stop_codon:yes gene_type:complete